MFKKVALILVVAAVFGLLMPAVRSSSAQDGAQLPTPIPTLTDTAEEMEEDGVWCLPEGAPEAGSLLYGEITVESKKALPINMHTYYVVTTKVQREDACVVTGWVVVAFNNDEPNFTNKSAFTLQNLNGQITVSFVGNHFLQTFGLSIAQDQGVVYYTTEANADGLLITRIDTGVASLIVEGTEVTLYFGAVKIE